MIKRRDFFLTTTTILLASLLSGCEKQYDLQVLLLEESIPRQLIKAFKEQLTRAKNLKFTPEQNFAILYDLLRNWQEKKDLTSEDESGLSFAFLKNLLPFLSEDEKQDPPDLISLGNAWLKSAIKDELITPLEPAKLVNLQNLETPFQELVKRDKQGNLTNNENGQIWAAPYRWGYTMIAYRTDKLKDFDWQLQDWLDLWRSQLKYQFSLLAQPREVIGLVLKKLGYSYNTDLSNFSAYSELKSELKSLHQQVKFYDSKNYLQPLILGDTWLAVGWSSDILPIVETYKNIEAIAPISGTSLWADLWVNPKNTNLDQAKLNSIYDWINFCWDTKSAEKINLFTNGVSPVNIVSNSDKKLNYIPPEIWQKSEFINPLNPDSQQAYLNLWQEIVS